MCAGWMQSFVRHVSHVAGRRTLISSGEMSEPKKLNWPSGQTYLQKAAPRKIVSTTNATAK